MKRICLWFSLFAPIAWAQEDPLAIVKRAVLKDENFFEAARDYTYTRHRVAKEFDKNDQPKVTQDITEEVLILYGRPYFKLIRQEGKELSPRDIKREEEKLNKELARRKKDQAKDAARERRRIENARLTAQEVAEAFDFRLAGVESIAGREAWAIDATPKPGYRAKTREARIYSKLSARMWIDRAESRWVKMDAQVNQTVSFGWFLLRLYPGAHFAHERIRIGDEIWLPKNDLARGEAKIGGIKTVRAEQETTYSDYRKFRADSTLIPGLE